MIRPIAGVFSLLLAGAAFDAAAAREISFAAYEVPTSGSLAIAVRKGVPAEGAFAAVDAASGGALRRAVDALDFKGEQDAKLALPGVGRYDQVLLVGLGDA